MPAQLLDGKAVANRLKEDLAQKVAPLDKKPGLAVVLVGDDPASQVYVGAKEKACQKIGMYSEKVLLPASTTQEELLAVIDRLNHDARIHGILIQLPLPPALDEAAVLAAVNPAKDVDGFHPINMGHLLGSKGKLPEHLLMPCTPKGIMKLIAESGLDLSGKQAVVIGRSNLVGKPVALMLLSANATVTVCHSRTGNLAAHCQSADIIVAAVGQEKLIKADMVKPGAVVIDVGVNRNTEGKIVGDVDFEQVKEVAGYLTPMPGGTGPMTIACLLENTLIAYRSLLNSTRP